MTTDAVDRRSPSWTFHSFQTPTPSISIATDGTSVVLNPIVEEYPDVMLYSVPVRQQIVMISSHSVSLSLRRSIYLISEVLDHHWQTCSFFDEIIRLCEEILRSAERSFASREQVHGIGHRRHVFRTLIIDDRESIQRDIDEERERTLAMSLFGSSHFSASASISDATNFISRPALAIFACSSVSSFVGLKPAERRKQELEKISSFEGYLWE